jgi:hypothetical protein
MAPRVEPGDVDPRDLPLGVSSPSGIAAEMTTVPLYQWEALVELTRRVAKFLEGGCDASYLADGIALVRNASVGVGAGKL